MALPTLPTLGIIGSGYIGSAVARLASAAGVPALLANSRGPESLAGLVDEIGGSLRAADLERAAAQEIVVLAVPFGALHDLPVKAFAGRIVVDAMNYFCDRDEQVGDLDAAVTTSSEYVQEVLVGTRVVKTLNTADFVRLPALARPHNDAERAALPVFGDDESAVAAVVELLDVLGYDAVELGPLSESWRAHPATPLYVTPYQGAAPEGVEDPGERFFRTPTAQAPAERIRELAASTVRIAPASISDVSSS